MNENVYVTRNKSRLVCKGNAQEEGIDYGDTFAPVARLEGVRILLAYATCKGFKVYQMNVKSAFLNVILEEEVYIIQAKGFVDPNQRNMVCKLHKALYELKQALRAWYERLHSYLISIGFVRTSDNNNLYLKGETDDKILIAKFFVDDIIFGGHDNLCKSFVDELRKEFEMSMFGEIKFFLGLQILQQNEGIYITQSKYIKEVLKTFSMEDSKLVGRPMVIGCKLTKDDKSTEVN